MKSLIFFNSSQKELLENLGINLPGLTEEKIQEIFSESDFYEIKENTLKLRKNNNILAKLGFGLEEDNDSIYKGGLSNYMLNKTAASSTGLLINAICTDHDTIILWEDNNTPIEYEDEKIFKQSLRNILFAMSKVLNLNFLIKTIQFEIAILV